MLAIRYFLPMRELHRVITRVIGADGLSAVRKPAISGAPAFATKASCPSDVRWRARVCVYWLPEFLASARKTKSGTKARQNSPAIHQIGRMIKEMPYISERLSSLRQEIADLRNLNARFSEKGGHNALDQTALELRTNRLREIKQELSKILNRPDDPKVWWERSRRPQQPA
jgi:hypothetical protein